MTAANPSSPLFDDNHPIRVPDPIPPGETPPPIIVVEIAIPRIRRQNPDFRDRTTPQHHAHRDAVMADVKVGGIKTPLWVKELLDGTFQLIAGGTRLEVAGLLGMTHVPCRIIKGDITRSKELIEQFQENALKLDFKDYERMLLLSAIMAETGWTAAQLCQNTPGLKEPMVCKLLAMKDLCPEVAEFAKQGKLNARVSAALARISDIPTQVDLAKKFVDGIYSVEGIENQKKKLLGKREKTVVAKDSGAVIQLPGEWSLEKIVEFAKRIEAAAKRGLKIEGLTAAAFPGLLQNG